MNTYHIDLWEERKMQFGNGISKICDSVWSMEKIMEKVENWKTMENIDGINGVHIIKSLDGKYLINQISGYTYNSGLFCYMVNRDGVLVREV